jgi:hypothetical protein
MAGPVTVYAVMAAKATKKAAEMMVFMVSPPVRGNL